MNRNTNQEIKEQETVCTDSRAIPDGDDCKAASVKRQYKDTVFRMLFSDKRELLTLYNAVNQTSYDNPDELEITTLENAVYMTIKNDLACLIDMRLDMYEHQSSVNPNMPLRDLDYVAGSFRKLYGRRDIYSSMLIKLPNPKFVVFYNGTAKQPARREFRLSDSYTHREENPSLELVVIQLNINPGYNNELMEKCPTLKEYMMFVECVHKYRRRDMEINEAVTNAVNECIKENILADFLARNKSEVIAMSIYEYDAKLHEKTLRQEGYDEGHAAGVTEAIARTARNLLSMNMPIDKIIQATGLSYEKLEELNGESV